MINWLNDQYNLQAHLSSALVKGICDDLVDLKKGAKMLGVTTAKFQAIITDQEEILTPSDLVDLFLAYNVSPLWMQSEMGEPIITANNVTGRVLKAMNVIVSKGGVRSYPEFLRILGISTLAEYSRLATANMELDTSEILNILIMFRINPVHIYQPLEKTPLFV